MSRSDRTNPLPGYFAAHPDDTQPAFAKRGEISLDTLRAWVQGRRRPSLTGAAACVRASNGSLTLDMFLGASAPAPTEPTLDLDPEQPPRGAAEVEAAARGVVG